jgi:hypothetical protein
MGRARAQPGHGQPGTDGRTWDEMPATGPPGQDANAVPAHSRQARRRDRSPATQHAAWPVRARRPPRAAWHVFPVAPGDKVPLKGWPWKERNTTGPAVISRFWARTPAKAGITTGPSGLVVIDLDVPTPGEAPPPRWDWPGIRDGARHRVHPLVPPLRPLRGTGRELRRFTRLP